MFNALKVKASSSVIAATLGASLIFSLPATATEFSHFSQPAVATSSDAELIDANFKHKKFKRGSFRGHKKFGHRSYSRHKKFGHRGYVKHKKFGHGHYDKKTLLKAKKFYLLKSAYPDVMHTPKLSATDVTA